MGMVITNQRLMRGSLVLFFVLAVLGAQASNPGYWQQRAEYQMTIDFDVSSHQFTGTQQLKYFNNSPDTIDRVYYHLYFNAFQPGSMMDVRSRTIVDGDPRVSGKINNLSEDEMGYLHVDMLKQDGADCEFVEEETILSVRLAEPLLPGESTVLNMEFKGQVPVQIRRSGRDNREGISYSMAQWYPKLSEYDQDGWHPNPYVGREFYGVWGDFDVTINIDRNYLVAGSGYLQNPETVGHSYAGTEAGPAGDGDKLSWRFVAPNVHDFVWAADPDYTHVEFERENGVVMHFVYQETEDNKEQWEKLPEIMDLAFDIIEAKYGEYPYKQYSFIQAGDGGMEYPMATLITGNRPLSSLVGVSVHELMHSWYQMILGSNESLYSWMDEGFTNYATAIVMNELARLELLPGRAYAENPFERSYQRYGPFSISEYHEPLTTHADHYNTNTAYGVGAYTKGSIFLNQLEYVIGKDAFDRTMLRYYNEWKFKHPRPGDFIRIAEKESDMVLDWYLEYWINTTHSIDYAVDGYDNIKGGIGLTLKRQLGMPMPTEVRVTMDNGDVITYYIPLVLMRGSKPADDDAGEWVEMAPWPWTNPEYVLEIPVKAKKIISIEIDPNNKIADVDRSNDIVEGESKKKS